MVNAFSFYDGASPYNALTGRQPACLPDLENVDFPKEGEDRSGLREERIRQASISAITQSTAVAKVNRAVDTKTTRDGSHYKPGQLIDYHRPTMDKDSHDGWKAPFPVIRNEPARGQVICRSGNREIRFQYPDARLTLFIKYIFFGSVQGNHEAL